MGWAVSGMTEEAKTGWFHCGRCGALFGAAVGGGVPGSCPECGRDPVVEEAELAFHQASGGGGPAEMAASQPQRRRKPANPAPVTAARAGSRVLLAVVVGWALLLLGIAGLVAFMRDDEKVPVADAIPEGAENRRVFQQGYEEVYRTMVAFLREGLPESRAKYVKDPGETLGKMVRWDEEIENLDEDQELEPLISHVIDTPQGRAIECVWELDGGRKVEGVFFPEMRDGEEVWLLDWELFSRYSEKDWSLFVTGSGEEVAEFRLLARRRAIYDDEAADSHLGVVLLAPNPIFPEKSGAPSPEIRVLKHSIEGRLIEKAFDRLESGEGAYGSESQRFDPQSMVRLRVKVRRLAGPEKQFEIEEVVAVHWLGIDDPGIE